MADSAGQHHLEIEVMVRMTQILVEAHGPMGNRMLLPSDHRREPQTRWPPSMWTSEPLI